MPAVDMPKSIQVIAGSFPIAQTRDPYSAVQFLAERLPLETIYRLTPPPQDQHAAAATSSSGGGGSHPFEWSAWTICEEVANKKGFFNRQGAPDVYRAANFILREVLDGVVTLYFTPPKA
jgi:ribosome biogenesis GTPase A